MRRLEYIMAPHIDQPLLLLCETPPQQEYQAIAFLGEGAYRRIGETLPSAALMRARLTRPDGERGVQEQDSLSGPWT